MDFWGEGLEDLPQGPRVRGVAPLLLTRGGRLATLQGEEVQEGTTFAHCKRLERELELLKEEDFFLYHERSWGHHAGTPTCNCGVRGTLTPETLEGDPHAMVVGILQGEGRFTVYQNGRWRASEVRLQALVKPSGEVTLGHYLLLLARPLLPLVKALLPLGFILFLLSPLFPMPGGLLFTVGGALLALLGGALRGPLMACQGHHHGQVETLRDAYPSVPWYLSVEEAHRHHPLGLFMNDF